MRYALVVLLLALATLLGTVVPDLVAPGPAAPVTEHHATAVDDGLGDRIITVVGDHPGHGAETIGLLCLCALLVTGIVLATRGASTCRVGPPVMAFGGDRPVGARTLVRALPRDPVLWGVSRT